MPKRQRQQQLPTDPIKSAVLVGLHYVEQTAAGFRRRRAGKGFCYFDPSGRVIRDLAHLKRIRSLVIPPAWRDVWICASPDGHLQAVGYDARGRRQYRYHPLYRQVRNETKFARMPDFAQALPNIRRQVNEHIKLPGLPREKVLATAVRLLETTFIRIGNPEYAKENESFGLTTLRNRHVDIEGSTIKFRFRGKSGVQHEVEIKDRRLAKIIKECHDLPGYELFEYIDDDGTIRSITSGDVNAYLREISGHDFTAKDFRTWAGTVQAALALAGTGEPASETEAKRNIVAAIKQTARRLGNRPATCRSYYVHPAVLESYMDRTLFQVVKPPDENVAPLTGNLANTAVAVIIPKEISNAQDLYPEEACVLKLIRTYTIPTLKAA